MAIIKSKNTQGKKSDGKAVKEILTENNEGKNRSLQPDNKLNKESLKNDLENFDKNKAARDNKRLSFDELTQLLEKAKSPSEKLELQNQIKRLKRREYLDGNVYNGDSHETIVNNTFGKTIKTMVPKFIAAVEYEYNSEKLNIDGKPEIIQRWFSVEFKFSGNKEQAEYAVKIRNQYLCKKDILRLYEAYAIFINEQMDTLLANYRKARERNIEERKNQLELFFEDFEEAKVDEIPVSLQIHSDYQFKKVELNFNISMYRGLYTLVLDKNNFLTSQDIYFLHSNYERIVNKALNKPTTA
jgi:hypothetical protein